MGLTDIFEQSGDFSRMTSEKVTMNWVRRNHRLKKQTRSIWSSVLTRSHLAAQLKHQGTITVNEEGTEAAALTQVGFMPLSSQIRFVVDHPFLFLIYEHRTDCLVFMGRVVNPSQN